MVGRLNYLLVLAVFIFLAMGVSSNVNAGLFDDIKKTVTDAADEYVKDVTGSGTKEGSGSPAKSPGTPTTSSGTPTTSSGTTTTSSGAPKSSSPPPDTAASAPQAASRGEAIPHSSGLPPSLMFSTVLNGVQVNYKSGKARRSRLMPRK